jgi:hypothetical protein
MSTRSSNKPPAAGPSPRKRVGSVPIADRPARKRRDWWPWNLMGGLVVVILGTGVLVWGLRAAIAGPPPVAPTPESTATAIPGGLPTRPPAEGTPVLDAQPSPTWSAPDALQSGPYATVNELHSTVGAVDPEMVHPVLPAAVPAAHMVFSEEGHDWGQIAPTGVISHIITVANPGNRPLKVDQLLSSCSCLSAYISSQDMPVGTRATLLVLYDPGLDGKTGQIERTLSILSTAGDTPVKELTFRAMLP